MIVAEGFCAEIHGFSLESVNLTVERGESFFLLGPSGAGKTLLLEALLGLYRPRTGRILLDGRDVTLLRPEERRIAYVPQDLCLFPHLSVRENILFGLTARGALPSDAGERLKRWSGLLDLGPLLERRDVSTLSGGERQRVALARALITEPTVLFTDEPFSALDAPLRRRLQMEFRELQKRLGLTVVQVTHDPEEAFLMADRMAILMEGRIQQTGRPGDLYNRPVNLKVARFLMLQNLFPGTIKEVTGDGYLKVCLENSPIELEAEKEGDWKAGAKVVVGIRPEEIILLRPDRQPDPARHKNLALGVIRSWADLGHYRLLRLSVGEMEVDSWVNIRAAREYPMEVGFKVWFHIRPHSFCFLPPETCAEEGENGR